MTVEGAEVKVIVDGKICNCFAIKRGVRQGEMVYVCNMFNPVLHKALKNLEHGNTVLKRLT